MMLCLPAVFNLFPIFIAFFYSYSIIAIDIYNTKFNKVLQENSPYEKAHSYASMNHLGGAMLLLY